MRARLIAWVRARVIWLLAGVAVVGVLAIVYVLPMIRLSEAGLDPEGRLKAENDLRTTLVQAVGGAIVLFGTWRTLQINREGQITERFTRAIEHLGHTEEKLDIRLGGIYALERIARDSKSDRGPIIEVLTAFLREQARWSPEGVGSPSIDQDATPGLANGEGPRLRADLQAAATVLARNGWAEQHRFDLSQVDLRNAKLYKAHLERAVFIGAHLEGTNLTDADLQEALLVDAHLEGARLHRAHLERAYLTSAQLQGANLIEAHMEGTYLGGAHLEGTYLGGAHLEGANLGGAHLRGTNLTGAHLRGADFTGAHLWDVIGLEHAQLALDGVIGLGYKPAQNETRPASEEEPD